MKSSMLIGLAIAMFRAVPYVLVLTLGYFFSKRQISGITIYMTYLQLFSVIVGFGYPQVFSVRISRAERAEVAPQFSASLRLMLMWGAGLLPFAVLVYAVLYREFEVNLIYLVIGLSAAIPLSLASNLCAVFIRNNASLGLFLINLFFLAALLVTVFFAERYSSVGSGLSLAVIGILYWLYFLIGERVAIRGFSQDAGRSVKTLEFLAATWQTAFLNLAASIVTPIGIVTVNTLLLARLGVEAQADFYLAYAIFSLLVFLPNAFTQQILIKLVSVRENRGAYRVLLRKFVGVHFISALGLALLVFVGAWLWLRLGGKFDLDRPQTLCFVLAAMVFYLISPMSQALLSIGHERSLLIVNVVWLLVFVALAVVLLESERVPLAAAYVMSFTLVALANYFILKRIGRI